MADIGIVRPVVLDQQLPFRVICREITRINPVALFQHHHAQARGCGGVRDDRAGGSGSDHEHVDRRVRFTGGF